MTSTISVTWWGNAGKIEIPDVVERLDCEERIMAVVHAIEAANPGTTCVTCRRDCYEQHNGRPVREVYQSTLGKASGNGFSVIGEIWISLKIENAHLGPQSLSYWDRLPSRRIP